MSRDIKVNVCVTLKAGILDPQGQEVHKTLHRMGFDDVASVRIGKYVEIELAGADPAAIEQRVSDMCQKLIANPVTEDFAIHVVTGEAE